LSNITFCGILYFMSDANYGFPEVIIHREILGEVGPQFIPEWPKPVDPTIDVGPLDTHELTTPVETQAEVVDALGLGECTEALSRFKSWMGISTSFETYPDKMVLEFAKWASTHTGGFTLVVSDELARFNWAAENGWDSYNSPKRVRQLERDATERAHEVRRMFDDHGLPAGVVLWNRMHRKIVEESQANDAQGMLFSSQEWSHLDHVAELPEFKAELMGVHQQLAAKLVQRFTEKGSTSEHVNHAMACYSLEEIFLSALLARAGWAPIKIGPRWEKLYDKMTANYVAGLYDGQVADVVPFGAVYLETPAVSATE
jgi:hypothetical protein